MGKRGAPKGSGLKLTPDVEEIILARLAEGEALAAICDDSRIPVTESAVRARVVDDEVFAARYMRARDIGWDCRGERAVEKTKLEGAAKNPQAARLEFDAERWYLGKMKPKVYGDKIDVTSGNEPIRPMDDSEKMTRIASIIASAQKRGDD